MAASIRRGIEAIKRQKLLLGFGGAATGLVTGEFSSEFTARTLGWTGYKKAGIKTAIKGLVGALFLGASAIPGAAPFTMPAALSTWGSIVLDWISAKYPGGVFGFAERLAVSVRKWAMGAEKVAAELAALEKATPTLTKSNSPRIIEERVGREVHSPFENTHTKAEEEIPPGPLAKDKSPAKPAEPEIILTKS